MAEDNVTRNPALYLSGVEGAQNKKIVKNYQDYLKRKKAKAAAAAAKKQKYVKVDQTLKESRNPQIQTPQNRVQTEESIQQQAADTMSGRIQEIPDSPSSKMPPNRTEPAGIPRGLEQQLGQSQGQESLLPQPAGPQQAPISTPQPAGPQPAGAPLQQQVGGQEVPQKRAIKPNEDPDYLEPVSDSDIRSSKENSQREMQQPSNFSFSGAADSAKDIFDSVGGDKVWDFAKNKLVDKTQANIQKLKDYGINTVDFLFDHASKVKSTELSEKYKKSKTDFNNSGLTVVQGDSSPHLKTYRKSIDEHKKKIDALQLKDTKDFNEFSKQRTAIVKSLMDENKELKKMKDNKNIELKFKAGEAANKELERDYIQKNRIPIMTKDIERIRKKRNEVFEKILPQVKKESLLHGSSFGSSLFKTAVMLIGGPMPDAYGKPPAQIIAEDAEQNFQTRLAEQESLNKSYKLISKTLNDDRAARDDYTKTALEIIKKRLEYSTKYRDETFKHRVQLFSHYVKLFNALKGKKQNKTDVSNAEVRFKARATNLDHERSIAIEEGKAIQGNIDSYNVAIKQNLDQAQYVSDEERLHIERIDKNIQTNNENLRADKKQITDQRENTRAHKLKAKQERNKTSQFGQGLGFKEDQQSDSNRQFRQKHSLDKTKESNKFAQDLKKLEFDKKALIEKYRHSEFKAYQKAKTQTQRDAILNRFKKESQNIEQDFKAKQSLLERNFKAKEGVLDRAAKKKTGGNSLGEKRFAYSKKRDKIIDNRFKVAKADKKAAADKKSEAATAKSLKKRTMTLGDGKSTVYAKLDDNTSLKKARALANSVAEFKQTHKDFKFMYDYVESVGSPLRAIKKGIQSLGFNSAAANEKYRYKNLLTKFVGKFRVLLTGGGVSSDRDMMLVRDYLEAGNFAAIWGKKTTKNKFIELFQLYAKGVKNDVINSFEDDDKGARQKWLLDMDYSIKEAVGQLEGYGIVKYDYSKDEKPKQKR